MKIEASDGRSKKGVHKHVSKLVLGAEDDGDARDLADMRKAVIRTIEAEPGSEMKRAYKAWITACQRKDGGR